MKIGNKIFDVKNHTYVMGILNVTPDSFSDGGSYNALDRALFHAEQMIQEGASILDVGGESTRPGYTLISDEEEQSRVVPVIEKLKEHFDVPISIDTYKSEVAKAAILAGADLVNDIWGFQADPKMAKIVADTKVACCLMHNRKEAVYEDYLQEVLVNLKESVRLAQAAGVEEDRIILDPGVGFAKSYEQNLQIIQHLDLLNALGYPVLLGTSRKSVIGLTLDLPANQRMEGTVATSVIGVTRGAAFVRVHDVKENYRAILMAEAILKS